MSFWKMQQLIFLERTDWTAKELFLLQLLLLYEKVPLSHLKAHEILDLVVDYELFVLYIFLLMV